MQMEFLDRLQECRSCDMPEVGLSDTGEDC